MKMKQIAILGATSHIAKGLVAGFLLDKSVLLHLFTRTPKNLQKFLAPPVLLCKGLAVHEGYSDFAAGTYDVIINCVGAGTLRKLEGDFSKYFMITEEFDNKCIAYLRAGHSKTIYVSLSSGIVYGREQATPATRDAQRLIRVNQVPREDYYAIARINAEAKHRSFEHLNIVDIRLFSYFSRFIDLEDPYFMSDVIKAVMNRQVLSTDSSQIIRDYIHPDDLLSLVKRCCRRLRINKAIDAMSRKPVRKREILEFFAQRYGLEYKVNRSVKGYSPTGAKKVYYSKYTGAAEEIGFSPVYTSMETIRSEAELLLDRRPG